MASFSKTFLMLPRELPKYLNVAYSLRYKDKPNVGSCIARIWRVIQRVFSLIKELICYRRPSDVDFSQNREKLRRDFVTINNTVTTKNKKPICVYFVSTHDHNGAILGKHLYYYHHYKIQNLQKYFAVVAKLVSSQDEMKDFMKSIKDKYPKREIKFVDVVSHGSKSSLSIHALGNSEIKEGQIRNDLFLDCARDATILLDACNTGQGDKNIANEIAQKTPGRKILAPKSSMFFSKPVIQIINNVPQVVSAVHGFAIFFAFKCNSFSCPNIA